MRKYRLCWDKLLSPCRVSISAFEGKENISIRFSKTQGDSRSPFERDYCHLVYSSSFRRLGRKTQVYPFADVDYVRCRLTHSLEVSTIAASLLRDVWLMFEAEGRHLFHYQDADWVLRTAGLAHDIGNPPYGHAGEKAIREWASKNIDEGEPYYRDFALYDGNGESFRLLSRNDIRKSLYHNLTVASLGAIVKYPYSVRDANKEHPKFGTFGEDEKIFDAVMNHLGLKGDDGKYIRHPLSFLLEAADDISYILADLEDSAIMSIFTEREVKRLYCEVLPSKCVKLNATSGSNGSPTNKAIWRKLEIESLRSKVADVLIKAYSKTFVQLYDRIMNGEVKTGDDFLCELPASLLHWIVKIRKKLKTAYASDVVVKKEKKGRKELFDLLDKWMGMLKYAPPFNKKIPKHDLPLVKQILGDDFKNYRNTRSKSWWAHVIMDYVVGMTDDFSRRCAGSRAI